MKSFFSAFWGAMLYSIVSFVLNLSIQPDGEFRVVRRQYSGGVAPTKDDEIIDVEGRAVDPKQDTIEHDNNKNNSK